jgi:hypothetical protein
LFAANAQFRFTFPMKQVALDQRKLLNKKLWLAAGEKNELAKPDGRIELREFIHLKLGDEGL